MWPFKQRSAPARRIAGTTKIRAFDAAESHRLLSSWVTSSTSADQALYQDLTKLRARARDLAINNPLARRILKLRRWNIVGPNGMMLQARTRMKSPPKQGSDLDKNNNALIEAAFEDWCRRGVCTVDRRFSFSDVQGIFQESKDRDGEFFVRHIRGRAAGNKYGYSLQLLEADRCDHTLNDIARNGNPIRLGIEIDKKWSYPVAYYFRRDEPSVTSFPSSTGVEYDRIPADEILHGYDAERAFQTRGFPLLAPIMKTLRMQGGYLEAELVAARSAAAKMGFLKTKAPDAYVGDGEETPGGAVVSDFEAGTIEQIGDAEFIPFDPQHPTSAFKPFIELIERHVAGAGGVAYESLSNNRTGVNFSSLRHGAIEERDTYIVGQEALKSQLCVPVYREWLTWAMTTGALPFPMGDFERYTEVAFIAKRWQWVDPLKDALSNEKQVSLFAKSLQDVAAEGGRDYFETVDRIAAEMEYAKQKGVAFNQDSGLTLTDLLGVEGEEDATQND